MKKIFFTIFVFAVLFSNLTNVFAESDINQIKENSNIILSIFTLDTLINIIFAIFAIIMTFIFSKIISSKVSGFIEKNGQGENREELVGVMSRTINILILGVGFTISLAILGVDITIFLGGLGFGIGFTLKIFLSNFIAGIVMVTQGSYHNGDLIIMGDKIGYIKEINSLFTKVEQYNGIIFFIPNIKFLENEVENINVNDKRRIEIDIGVDFETDIVKAKKIMLQIIDNFPNILKAPEPIVIITKFNESSINLSLRFWINSRSDYLEMKSNITETINLGFKQYGIKIPFPQLTLSTRGNSSINIEQIKN